MRDLIADGNSVLLVDHDTQVLSKADWLLELGPQAGANGGTVIAPVSYTHLDVYKRQILYNRTINRNYTRVMYYSPSHFPTNKDSDSV